MLDDPDSPLLRRDRGKRTVIPSTSVRLQRAFKLDIGASAYDSRKQTWGSNLARVGTETLILFVRSSFPLKIGYQALAIWPLPYLG